VEGDNKITNQKLQKEDDIVEENVGWLYVWCFPACKETSLP
jgi:hypothetical protein